jgi:hypothetical protein
MLVPLALLSGCNVGSIGLKVTSKINATYDSASADVGVTIQVVVDYEECALGGCRVHASGGRVRAGVPGKPLVALSEISTGVFEGYDSYSTEYAIEVEARGDHMSGSVALPGLHRVTLSPDPPVVGGPLEVRWSPSNEGVSVGVSAHETSSSSSPGTCSSDNTAGCDDDGAEQLAASYFPTAGDYQISVQRSSDRSGAIRCTSHLTATLRRAVK